MGGPPYVMYLAGRIADPDAQRATISQMVILNVGLRVVAFAVAGLLVSPALWLAVAILLPVAWAGVWVGHRAHLRLAPATAARIIAATLFMAGAALVARTLWEAAADGRRGIASSALVLAAAWASSVYLASVRSASALGQR